MCDDTFYREVVHVKAQGSVAVTTVTRATCVMIVKIDILRNPEMTLTQYVQVNSVVVNEKS